MKIEQETKLQLDRCDFELLLEKAQIKRHVDQLNVYYDAEDQLSRASATFRIRFLSAKVAVMTLKVPLQEADGARRCVEIESEVAACRTLAISVGKDMPDEFSERLRELGIHKLKRIGRMRTHRWVVQLEDVEVELDEVRLPNGEEFFEVEIESDQLETHKAGARLVMELAASARPSCLSKYERFVEAVRNK